MIRKSLVAILLMLGSFVFANDWNVQEVPYENYVYYLVTDAPEKYNNLIGTMVFAWQSRSSYRNLYESSCKDGIIKFLNKEDFSIEIDPNNGIDSAFLSVSFMENYFPELFNINIPVTKTDLEFIWDSLSSKYAGFSEMKKKGFNQKKLYKIDNTKDLKKLLDKYIEDCHFQLRIREFTYEQGTAYDKGSKKSRDPLNTYFEKETSNAYYVRFTSCGQENELYNNNLQQIAQKAEKKDFIILDARSNNGGSDMPQISLRRDLNNLKYKGTVLILQDNWSFSSGEVWHIFGVNGLKFKRLLVGTHSGGMQNYGNCQVYSNVNKDVVLYFGYSNFRKNLPSNYLGDGKGYEPDVWATTETMASVLTDLGVDVTGIEFK